jgi:hypothetical protein
VRRLPGMFPIGGFGAWHGMASAVGTIVVNATVQAADAILLVASRSYLVLGVAAPHRTRAGPGHEYACVPPAGAWHR